MSVEIDNGHFRKMAAQHRGCDGGIVEEAEAGGPVGISVVARRTAKGEAGWLSRQHSLRTGNRRLRRGVSGLERARHDRAGHVADIPARPA
jgi:hypothetical protein